MLIEGNDGDIGTLVSTICRDSLYEGSSRRRLNGGSLKPCSRRTLLYKDILKLTLPKGVVSQRSTVYIQKDRIVSRIRRMKMVLVMVVVMDGQVRGDVFSYAIVAAPGILTPSI